MSFIAATTNRRRSLNGTAAGLATAIAGAVGSEQVKAAFAKMLIEPFATSLDTFAKLIRADHDLCIL